MSPGDETIPVRMRERMLGLAAILVVLAMACSRDAARPLMLATTTSVGHSGLLDVLVPAYERETGTKVHTQLVGSGLALRMLADNHVHVVISHAPAAEQEALASHPAWAYRKLMFNDFLVAGPASDPAAARHAPDVADAMRRIARSTSTFLSRGDRSGTHEREEQLWQLAGMRPAAQRLVVAGTGMGSTLRTANETGAYTLSDRATYAQLAARLPRLSIVFDGGPLLLNAYAVVYDAEGARAEDAAAFARWLIKGQGRAQIERYVVGEGTTAFHAWPADRPGGHPSDLPFER